MDPDLARDLLPIVQREARERLAASARILDAGFPEPHSAEFNALYRHAHTLKSLAHLLERPDLEARCAEVALKLRTPIGNPRNLSEDEKRDVEREIRAVREALEA